MQDVTITFISGPMKNSAVEFEVGRLMIGRDPGQKPGYKTLQLMHADESTSRDHAELVENEGEIALVNLSPNGTSVEGKRVTGKNVTVPLRPGVTIKIGNSHVFEVHWTSFNASIPDKGKDGKTRSGTSQGPLSSPLVRSVMGVYLLAMLALVVWLKGSGSGGDIVDDWPSLEQEYAAYQPADVSPDVLTERSAQAHKLVRELQVFRMQGLSSNVEKICREIMSLDEDIHSPLFQYGARCLGSGYHRATRK